MGRLITKGLMWRLGSACPLMPVVLNRLCVFIQQAARSSGGRVLLHCSQGVSRSASLAIGYLMWRRGGSFDEVLASVKAIRGVANPNIGFTCQVWPQEPTLNCYCLGGQARSWLNLIIAQAIRPHRPETINAVIRMPLSAAGGACEVLY